MSAAYRCYFFTPDRKVSGFQDFRADSDAEAIATAKALAIQQNAPPFELWQGMRHVHTEG
jgi:hypothetical protein